MDVPTIDREYEQLQDQAQQTTAAIKSLAAKLQSAAQGGNQDAREWMLDLKEVALAVQAEQNQMALLLQALHGFIANRAPPAPQQLQPSPWGQQPPASPMAMPGYGQPQQGGMLGGFLNSGFGRAIEMGAGFGIGDDLINKRF